MKKANKAAAKDWQQQEQAKAQKLESFENQKHLLWYAANKRKSGYPCAQTLRELGLNDVADKVSQAYGLLFEADNMMPESYNVK